MKGIYIIKFDNGSSYIGRSVNIPKRIRGHKHRLKNKIHKNLFLQNVYNKCGKFVWEILEECEYNTHGSNEKKWIKLLSPNLNMTEGGDGGEILNERGKEIMKSKNIYNEEYRKKMSEKMKSIKLTPEQLKERGRKISEARKKLYSDPETKKRLIEQSKIQQSDGYKKQKRGSDSPNAKRVINIETKEVYGSLKDVAKIHKLNYKTLINRMNEYGGKPNTTPYRYL